MNPIFQRTSVRKFSNMEIDIEEVKNLIKAGMQAPSACNSQPWEFLIVTEKEDKIAVSQMSQYAKPAANADKLIITMANLDKLKKTKTEKWFCQDLSACNENILLQATAKGIGAVWLGFYPDEKRVENLRNYFKIPESIIPFSVIALGFPEEEPIPRKNFNPEKIHIGRY